MRYVLCKREMAWRYAYQLQDHPEQNRTTSSQIETMSEDGTFDVLPKKEVIELKKEWEKLEKNLGGIKDMPEYPGCNLRS